MKVHVILLVTLFPLIVIDGSAQTFDSNTKVLSAGVGIGSSLGSSAYTTQSPGMSLQYEQGIWEIGGPGTVSLGAYLGFKNFGQDYTSFNYNASAKWNYTIIGVRSAYHYAGLENNRIDVYGGLMLSYNILNYSIEQSGGQSVMTNAGSSTAGFTLYVGGRYYFVENIGVFTELGYGISYVN